MLLVQGLLDHRRLGTAPVGAGGAPEPHPPDLIALDDLLNVGYADDEVEAVVIDRSKQLQARSFKGDVGTRSTAVTRFHGCIPTSKGRASFHATSYDAVGAGAEEARLTILPFFAVLTLDISMEARISACRAACPLSLLRVWAGQRIAPNPVAGDEAVDTFAVRAILLETFPVHVRGILVRASHGRHATRWTALAHRGDWILAFGGRALDVLTADGRIVAEATHTDVVSLGPALAVTVHACLVHAGTEIVWAFWTAPALDSNELGVAGYRYTVLDGAEHPASVAPAGLAVGRFPLFAVLVQFVLVLAYAVYTCWAALSFRDNGGSAVGRWAHAALLSADNLRHAAEAAQALVGRILESLARAVRGAFEGAVALAWRHWTL